MYEKFRFLYLCSLASGPARGFIYLHILDAPDKEKKMAIKDFLILFCTIIFLVTLGVNVWRRRKIFVLILGRNRLIRLRSLLFLNSFCSFILFYFHLFYSFFIFLFIFSDTNGINHMGLNNIPDPPRLVTLQRSAAGYGFQMRGANCKYRHRPRKWTAQRLNK